MLSQSQPSPLTLAQTMSQVGIPRTNLNLKQIEQIGDSAAAMAINGQPLSPTQTSTNRLSNRMVKESGKQRSLKGPPQQVGLTSIEYAITPKTHIVLSELQSSDSQINYFKDLNDDSDFPFKSQIQHDEMHMRVEIKYILPFGMAVEQIEIQVLNHDLLSKYLKLLRVETSNVEHSGVLHLRGGFYDLSKKIIELNTCGVTNTINVMFIYNLENRPKQKNLITGVQQPSNQLNQVEDEMDDLDDEVAMISNKKSQEGGPSGNTNDYLKTEDIKIEIKSGEYQRSVKSASNRNEQQRKQTADQAGDDDCRNFVAIQRNYTNSQAKDALQSEQAQQSLAILENEIFKHSESNPQLQVEVTQLLQKCITCVKVIGFNCNQIPAITTMPTFMNNSFLLKKEGYLSEASENDFMIGILMISSKRYIQAVEVFRKIQAIYLKQIDAKLKDQAYQSKNPQQAKLEVNKLFIRCALLELLTVESMCQSVQINDKLVCMKRMCDLFQGKIVPVQVFSPQNHLMDDPYTTILRLLPVLLKFVLMCVTHKKEIIRMSSMKLLEFILETKGCSLDQSMVFILKAMLTTYPTQPGHSQSQQQQTHQLQQDTQVRVMAHQDSFSISNLSNSVQEYFQYQSQKKPQPESQPVETFSEYKDIKEPNSGFTSALKNIFNHVLETYISVLSSISSHILHQLFYEVIIPTLTSQTSQAEVKIFAIKIAEKIITICQGDLLLNKQSLEFFLQAVGQKQSALASQDQQQFVTNLRNLWTSVRTKVFANYSQKGLKTLIDWLVDKMSMIAQNAGINNKEMTIGAAMNEDQLDDQSNPDISKLEITDEEGSHLSQIFDIISVISQSRKKNEEEANSNIKIKQDYILELYLLINPLLFWIDFSVEREERFGLFKSVYQTIKDVLENLPPKRTDIDLLQIMIPILQRTTEFLKNSSPSLSMLKFLEIVLRDIKSGGYCQMQSDLQYFFLEMLNNYVSYISYCPYEEVFSVFDKLLSMCSDVINEKVLVKCITAMVDKYTIKSKSHKNSLTQFMKVLMEVKVRNRGTNERRNRSNNNNIDSDEHDFEEEQMSVHSKNNYFEILCNFCFFNNEDVTSNSHNRSLQPIESYRSPADLHDFYSDKLQFFIDSLQILTEIHITLFTSMITNPKFKTTTLALLQKGELPLRLKCHEILEVVTNYFSMSCISRTVYELALPASQSSSHLTDFHKKKPVQSEVMEVEFINQERLHISQIVVQCVKISLDQKNDSYLQFNSLILLDFLFQNLLPVPTFQNEQLKDKAPKSGGSAKSNQNQSINNFGNRGQPSLNDSQVLDIETLEINDQTPEFEVTQRQYALMRLNLIFKLWQYVQQALNSAWSNIRSICYGLICSMLKIDIRDFQTQANGQVNQQFLLKLKQIVLPMLMNLLSSKESESKAGGLNILGSFCGLSYDFTSVKISKNFDFFKKNSQFISLSIWQLVFDLQDDWDITIKEASVVLIQLCAPRDAVKYFDKVKRERENIKYANILSRYGMGANGDQSSRLSSSRGVVDAQMQFLNSAASMNGENEDLLSGIPQTHGKHEKGLLSFLSGTADDMSLVFQMEQHHNMQVQQNQTQVQALNASADLLEHIQGPTGLPDPHQRNERRIVGSASEEIKEQIKKNANPFLGEFDDALQYQEIMDNDTEASHFLFFVDKYSDEQIQEIISIFRNDFKPPKNLWIEKNPSAAFNSPDYYAEIYSSAIEQFNQQQMQLQQQQQQELQMKVSSSPKSNLGNLKGGNMVDALEDDIVQKFENEKKDKQKPLSEGADNFMIFERHFEDKHEEAESLDSDNAVKTDNLSVSSSNAQSLDNCSIDAEPFQFLDNPVQEKQSKSKDFVKQQNPQINIQILEEEKVPKQAKGLTKDKTPLTLITQQPLILNNEGRKSKEYLANQQLIGSQAGKKTTDELIEEYERKINKTKSLLEEEKKRVAKKSTQPDVIMNVNTVEIKASLSEQDLLNNLTPEFKSKLPSQDANQFVKLEDAKIEMIKDTRSQPKKVNATQPPQVLQSNQLQSYLTEFQSKGYISGQDNAKLLKQIKNCFNDNALTNYGIGSTTLSTTPQGGPISKSKQKLNKSYENLLASNRNKTQNDVIGIKPILAKKNLSTSPRRGSSSGKKNGSSKLNNKKKYLQQQQNYIQDQANVGKAKNSLFNMRDLDYFMKNIQKDLTDKHHKGTLKDFNSMPTTPTSILKKVEDQMRAIAQSKDIKAQMSNTCPNIAQVLSSLESNTSKSVSSASGFRGQHPHTGIVTHRDVPGATLLQSGHGANFQTINSHSMMIGQSHNSLSNYPGSAMSYHTQGNLGDKFTFSKTQKIDFKDTNKNIFSYQIPVKDGNTHRDSSSDPKNGNSLSPFKDEKQHFANLLKQSKHHKKSGKRSRGSTDKYSLLGAGIGVQAASAIVGGVNYGSSSSSYARLNKSANYIQAGTSSTSSSNVTGNSLGTGRIKEQAPSSAALSQQLINSFAKANNMSPNNKKLLQQMVKHQFIQPQVLNSGLPQSLSAQNNSITHEIGDNNSKRGAALSNKMQTQPKEKTPKKINTQRNEVPTNIKTLSQMDELSPMGRESTDKYSAALRNTLKGSQK